MFAPAPKPTTHATQPQPALTYCIRSTPIDCQCSRSVIPPVQKYRKPRERAFHDDEHQIGTVDQAISPRRTRTARVRINSVTLALPLNDTRSAVGLPRACATRLDGASSSNGPCRTALQECATVVRRVACDQCNRAGAGTWRSRWGGKPDRHQKPRLARGSIADPGRQRAPHRFRRCAGSKAHLCLTDKTLLS